jgi:hypothetical protein
MLRKFQMEASSKMSETSNGKSWTGFLEMVDGILVDAPRRKLGEFSSEWGDMDNAPFLRGLPPPRWSRSRAAQDARLAYTRHTFSAPCPSWAWACPFHHAQRKGRWSGCGRLGRSLSTPCWVGEDAISESSGGAFAGASLYGAGQMHSSASQSWNAPNVGAIFFEKNLKKSAWSNFDQLDFGLIGGG